MDKPKILLMGCGGIGGVIAASLLERGEDVTIVTHNPAIAAAINAAGLIVEDEKPQRTVPGQATVTIPDGDRRRSISCSWQRIPPKPKRRYAAPPGCWQRTVPRCVSRTDSASAVSRPSSAHRGPSARLWRGVARCSRLGRYERTSAGGFTIGELDGSDHPRLDTLRRMLGAVGPVDVTHNLRGARWSKLAINCAISSLGTIGGARLGALLKYRMVRRLALEIMTEAVAVARARGVRLEKVSGTIDLDWVALTESERLISGSPTLHGQAHLAVGRRREVQAFALLDARGDRTRP